MTFYDKMIVALDYENPEDAFRLVEEVGHLITWFKIGPILFTQHGPEVIRFLHRKSKKIFVDLKLHDTPNIVSHTIRQLAEMGVKLATVHCLGGKTMLEAASRACRGSELKLIGLTLLTSNDSQQEVVLELVDLAKEIRLSGILCAPQDVPEIRKRTESGFLLITPGIRLRDQEIFLEDQKCIATPEEAIRFGSDYLIIGRPLIQTREPRLILQKIMSNLSSPTSL